LPTNSRTVWWGGSWDFGDGLWGSWRLCRRLLPHPPTPISHLQRRELGFGIWVVGVSAALPPSSPPPNSYLPSPTKGIGNWDLGCGGLGGVAAFLPTPQLLSPISQSSPLRVGVESQSSEWPLTLALRSANRSAGPTRTTASRPQSISRDSRPKVLWDQIAYGRPTACALSSSLKPQVSSLGPLSGCTRTYLATLASSQN
jgi:hypothetical protein